MNGRGKFYDGIRPVSISVRWEIREDQLIIFNEMTESRFPSWEIKEVVQDKNQNTALVLKNQFTGEYLEILEGAEALPRGLFTKKKVSFHVGQFVGLIVGLIFIIFGLWKSLPFISKKAAYLIPVEKEVAWSKAFKLSDGFSSKKCEPGPSSERAWNKLISRIYPLYPGEKWDDIHIQIIPKNIKNAYALPGNNILVFEGLLGHLRSPEELAGILAHEIGHIKERHILQKIISSFSIVIVFQFISGDFSSVFALDPATVMGIAALSFDRDMESEADEFSYERLIAAKVNPKDLGDFFERTLSGADILPLLSTHPVDMKRAQLFRTENSNKFVPILSKEEWLDLKDYCGHIRSN